MSKMEKLEIDEWFAIREAEALRIDPQTAELHVEWGGTLDPYGVLGLPEGEDQIQPNYFARNPNSKIWVCFCDLPTETIEALRARIEAGDFESDEWLF
jgi:hypothetical protein